MLRVRGECECGFFAGARTLHEVLVALDERRSSESVFLIRKFSLTGRWRDRFQWRPAPVACRHCVPLRGPRDPRRRVAFVLKQWRVGSAKLDSGRLAQAANPSRRPRAPQVNGVRSGSMSCRSKFFPLIFSSTRFVNQFVPRQYQGS